MNVLIVLTFSEKEVETLHNLVRDKFENVNYWGKPIQDYNTEWCWVYKNKQLSGTAGWNSLRHTIDTYPEAEILNIKQFSFAKIKT